MEGMEGIEWINGIESFYLYYKIKDINLININIIELIELLDDSLPRHKHLDNMEICGVEHFNNDIVKLYCKFDIDNYCNYCKYCHNFNDNEMCHNVTEDDNEDDMKECVINTYKSEIIEIEQYNICLLPITF